LSFISTFFLGSNSFTQEEAFQIAESDSLINYFVYMKSSMFLEGKEGPGGYIEKGVCRRMDAVFFSLLNLGWVVLEW
jgi:hypothetical protein